MHRESFETVHVERVDGETFHMMFVLTLVLADEGMCWDCVCGPGWRSRWGIRASFALCCSLHSRKFGIRGQYRLTADAGLSGEHLGLESDKHKMKRRKDGD